MSKRQRDNTNDLAKLRETESAQDRRAIALDILRKSRDLEIVRAALMVLAEEHDPELRPVLHEK
ncbi:MAG: hypothetical protein M3412_04430, partial [Chloroflexota bacterium]|nr:hypothetical protein [Chloroflexota bacterium]